MSGITGLERFGQRCGPFPLQEPAKTRPSSSGAKSPQIVLRCSRFAKGAKRCRIPSEERLKERADAIRPELAEARKIAEKAEAENRDMTAEERRPTTRSSEGA